MTWLRNLCVYYEALEQEKNNSEMPHHARRRVRFVQRMTLKDVKRAARAATPDEYKTLEQAFTHLAQENWALARRCLGCFRQWRLCV